MVHLPGKGIGGRRVPLILSPEVVQAMNLLADKRTICNVPKTNVFFFAVPSTDGHLNGWQVMDRLARKANLEKPDRVHGTALRKYMATVIQVREA